MSENARVIRIIDESRLILNVGTQDGIQRGDEFGIYTPTVEIVDPESGENLGRYRERKTTVRANFVADRYTIASPPPKYSGFTMFRLSSPNVEPRQLPVDKTQIDPLPTTSLVRVGDTASLLRAPTPEKTPDQETPEAVVEPSDNASEDAS
jgi:hypothetical protein